MDLKSQMKLEFSRVKFCVHVDLYVVDQGSNGFKVLNGVKVFSCKVLSTCGVICSRQRIKWI